MAAPAQRTPDEETALRRRRRSIAIGLALGAIVILFYVMTIVKMGPAVFQQ